MSLSETFPAHAQPYLSIKRAKAAKAGPRSQGYVHYRVLTDAEHAHLFLTLTANDSSGCFSREIVPVARIEAVLQGVDASQPIASKLFRPCFVSKSQNNAGFLAAVLRHEQLLQPVPDAPHQHAVVANWSAWKTALLSQVEGTEPFEPDVPKPRSVAIASSKSTAAMPEAVEAVARNAGDGDDDQAPPDLSDAELALLQQGDSEDAEEEGDDTLATLLDKRPQKRQPRERLKLPTQRGDAP